MGSSRCCAVRTWLIIHCRAADKLITYWPSWSSLPSSVLFDNKCFQGPPIGDMIKKRQAELLAAEKAVGEI